MVFVSKFSPCSTLSPLDDSLIELTSPFESENSCNHCPHAGVGPSDPVPTTGSCPLSLSRCAVATPTCSFTIPDNAGRPVDLKNPLCLLLQPPIQLKKRAIDDFVSSGTIDSFTFRRNGHSPGCRMDLTTSPSEVAGLFRLRATSILGALWLQTHFPKKEWDTLLSDQASFGHDCLNSLIEDAKCSGLTVNQLAFVEF